VVNPDQHSSHLQRLAAAGKVLELLASRRSRPSWEKGRSAERHEHDEAFHENMPQVGFN
jgi:hypothetical protein